MNYKVCKERFGVSIDTANTYLRMLTGISGACLSKATEDQLKLLDEFCLKSKEERQSIIYRWTCEQRYGKDYFKEHAQKGRETKKEHFGEDFDKVLMSKAKQNGLANNPNMVKDNAQKAQSTKKEKYTKEQLSEIARNNALKAIQTKRQKYGENYFSEMGKENYPKTLQTKLDKYGTNWPKNNPSISEEEKQLRDFVLSLNQIVFFNVRDVLGNGKELDIYFPEKKVALEYDGWYWHSEAYLTRTYSEEEFLEQSKKIVNKNADKTKLCAQKGIRLIHILDLLWNRKDKQDIFKSIIKSALGIYDKKYFARKLMFKEIDSKTGRNFLDQNHIQGSAKSSRYFALFDNDQIIQVMSFDLKSSHEKDKCELTRMCTLKNIQVVGGFSKLVKNSLKALNVSECISYVDLTTFNGSGYTSSGFEFVSDVKPVYYYIFRNELKRREFGMRKNIEKKFNEHIFEYWNPNQTEFENMYLNGVFKIWDCGKLKLRFELK